MIKECKEFKEHANKQIKELKEDKDKLLTEFTKEIEILTKTQAEMKRELKHSINHL